MNGYAIINDKFCDSDDLELLKAAMPRIKASLDAFAEQLSPSLPGSELDDLFKKIDSYSEKWNRNVEVLNHFDRLGAISDVKESIRQLKWPPDEAGAAGSSS